MVSGQDKKKETRIGANLGRFAHRSTRKQFSKKFQKKIRLNTFVTVQRRKNTEYCFVYGKHENTKEIGVSDTHTQILSVRFRKPRSGGIP